jgi:hypothetical protein
MKIAAQKQAENNVNLGLNKQGEPAIQTDVDMTDKDIAAYDKGMRDVLTSVVIVGATDSS